MLDSLTGFRLDNGFRRRTERSGAGPVLQESLGDDGGVVRGKLLENQEREWVARQGQRVAGPIGRAAEPRTGWVRIGDLSGRRGPGHRIRRQIRAVKNPVMLLRIPGQERSRRLEEVAEEQR